MKLKYLYNVYHLMDTFPTDEDVFFMIYKYMTENEKLEEEFTDKGIKNVIDFKIPQEKLVRCLDSLVESKHIIKREGTDRNFFKFVKNEY